MSIAWHHWSNYQLDPQYGERGCGLGNAKPVSIGGRCQRVALYVHGQEKVTL